MSTPKRATWAVAPFPWFGGKQRLARRIVDLLPPHLVYVEPFGGAAAVLLSKPTARLEVYNDLNEGLVTFFRALRDHPDEFERRLRLTPFSRGEFELCRDTWRDAPDDVEKARRWYVRVEQAFAGTERTRGWGGEFSGRRRQSRAETSVTRLDRLSTIAARFRTVQVEQLEWRQVLDRYDGPDAVFYLDPPYLPSTRRRPNHWSGGQGYEHELTAEDHEELIARVLELQAAVLVSGYDSPLYEALDVAGFERFEFDAMAASASAVGGDDARRREIVWRKASPEGRLFDNAAAGGGGRRVTLLPAHDQDGGVGGQHLDDDVRQGPADRDRVARSPVRHREAAYPEFVAGHGDQPEPVARHAAGGYR